MDDSRLPGKIAPHVLTTSKERSEDLRSMEVRSRYRGISERYPRNKRDPFLKRDHLA